MTLAARATLAACAALACLPLAARETATQAWPAAVPTPALQLDDLDGRAWTLADLRGKVVVVSFWATWCEYCVEELAFLNSLAHSEPRQLAVLGVNYKESARQVRRFAAADPLDFPVLLDKSGASFAHWAGVVLPTTILVDRKGKARWRSVGALDPTDSGFRQALQQLLKE